MKQGLIVIFFTLMAHIAMAQITAQEAIEYWVQQASNEALADEDMQAYRIQLEQLVDNPIVLNVENISKIPFLSANQSRVLTEYVMKHTIQSILELQQIPDLLPEVKQSIGFFVRIEEKKTIQPRPVFRFQQILRTISQPSVGYTIRDSLQRFIGAPIYQKTRLQIAFNTIRFGYVFEKDFGESFKQHMYTVFLEGNSQLNRLHWIIGDFQMSTSLGILSGAGISARKSTFSFGIAPAVNTYLPMQSSRENSAWRGVALEYSFKKIFKFDYSVGFRKQDAGLQFDTITDEFYFQSINFTGLHRNAIEINRKGSITQIQHSIGFSIKQIHHQLQFRLAELYQDPMYFPVNGIEQTWNSAFHQKWAADFCWSGLYRTIRYWAESTLLTDMKKSLLFKSVVALDAHTDFCFSLRHFDPGIKVFSGNAFSKFGDNQNEQGLFLSIQNNARKGRLIKAWLDIYRSPWYRYSKQYALHGQDLLIEAVLKHANSETLYRIRWMQETSIVKDIQTNIQTLIGKFQYVLRYSNSTQLNMAYLLGYRSDPASYYAFSLGLTRSDKKIKWGLQNQLMRVENARFPISTRDSDLGGSFLSYTSYYDCIRSILFGQLKWKSWNVQLEWVHTLYPGRNQFGSGLNMTYGNAQNEIRCVINGLVK